jgi:hypothetical protein
VYSGTARVALPVAIMVIMLVGAIPSARAAGERDGDSGTRAGEQANSGAGRGDLESVAPQRGLPVEQERDLGHGPSRHEPVFLEPAATTTEHTRFGLSAWIAPAAPFDRHENPGGPAIGFTITWPRPTSAREASASDSGPWRGSAAR